VKSKTLIKTIIACIVVAGNLLFVNAACSEVVERIVAIVNDDLILLSDFREALRSARETDSSLSEEDVLNEMIENMLLLNEAKKYRTGAPGKNRIIDTDSEAVIQEYIDRRIKALIHIPYDDIETYYQMHRERYGDKDILDVRDEIEDRLVEKELAGRVRGFIEELRKKAYIRIQLNGSG